ncbi:MAG: LysM peptidoglycan-binding domain-containing protein [Elusimicrobia bacterium]|nr:LysM peptidoglycan-binding domain-containing protein [Elusimicrobiota bacterium]
MSSLWILAAIAAAAQAAALRHTVVPTDTMWDLAGRYYGDHFEWRRIADANPPPDVHDPHWIYPGQVLIIPDREGPPEAAPAPAPPAKPVRFTADPGPGTEAAPESLSTRFPTGLVGAPPSNYRMRALPGWSPDGAVTGFDGREIMAAEGDPIDVSVEKRAAAAGERFVVYRTAGPTEADADKTATYVVKIGLIQVRKPLTGNRYRAVILKSNDSVQVGDVIVRED